MTDWEITRPGSWLEGSWLEAFADFLRRSGDRQNGRTPWALVEDWESLVSEAEAGYQWTVYEFDNELGVRDLLAKALADERLGRFAEMASVRQRVEAADTRLDRAFLRDQQIRVADNRWWRRGVLAVGGEGYADDVERLYGIVVTRAPAGDGSPIG